MCWLKFAVTDLFASIVTDTGFVLPVASPVHESKNQPAAGVAVTWTIVPWVYDGWFGAGVAVPLPTVDNVSVNVFTANEAAIVWFACTGGNGKLVTAPTDEPFTSTSCTWKPAFGVI